MIVCVCNAVSEREIRRVLGEGEASTPEAVYQALGITPRCGTCRDEVMDMILDVMGSGSFIAAE